MSWRGAVFRRLGWGLAAATAWTWGLLLIRMLRDGLQPLEVWFSYGLSFWMTAVYVYLGLTILATFRRERGDAESSRPVPEDGSRSERLRRPATVAGVAGALLATVSIAMWLALRFPGPQAVSGTIASGILALMVLGVVAISTLIARGAH
jgi:hypothetical protein